MDKPLMALYLSLFRLLRIVRGFRLFRKVNITLSFTGHVQLTQFIFWIIIVVNLSACGWILISPQQAISDNITVYVAAVYWVVMTMTTVGYGDITPITILSRIYAMVIMMAGVGMYGFIIGKISSILTSFDAQLAVRREKIATLASMMKEYEIPAVLQENIFSFYTHQLHHTLSEHYDRILSELPSELENELREHIYTHFLSKVPLFQNVSRECLKEIAHSFKSETFSPGELIIKEGDIGTCMYILLHGVIEFTKEKKQLSRLRTGGFFGEVALLRETRRSATAIAVTYCHVYRLENDDLTKIFDKNPNLRDTLDKAIEENYPDLQP